MRLLHKDLIPYLPTNVLMFQWEECSAIADKIINHESLKFSLSNYVLDYPIEHFVWYSMYVRVELTRRNFVTSQNTADKIWSLLSNEVEKISVDFRELFKKHHDKTYFKICMWNLYEAQIRELLSADSKLSFDDLIK